MAVRYVMVTQTMYKEDPCVDHITLPHTFPADWCLRDDGHIGEVKVQTEEELVDIVDRVMADSDESDIMLIRCDREGKGMKEIASASIRPIHRSCCVT